MNEHILPRNNGWAVKREGSKRASKIFPKKDQAVAFAKKKSIRNESSVFVHKMDGTIQEVTKPLMSTNKKIPKSKVDTKRQVHVVPKDDGWAVKNEHRKQVAKTFESKYKAVRYAHNMADNNNAIMVIHRSNGEINHIDIPPHYQSMASDILHLR